MMRNSSVPAAMSASLPPRPGGRIPPELQAVFLASNRGEEVNEPPPDRAAFRSFLRRLRSETNLARTNSKRKLLNRSQHASSFTSGSDSSSVRMMDNSGHDGFAWFFTLFQPTISPQVYLDALLRNRGYSTETFEALKSGYSWKPSRLQVASYHVHLLDLVRKDDLEGFRAVMQVGISLNPCNEFGESLLHYVCRRGKPAFLRVLIELGCSLQVCDDYGRTPLHDACWTITPCFEVVELILHADRRLIHITDCRGALPLSYVRKESWDEWLTFFANKKDLFWQPRDKSMGAEPVPELASVSANSRHLVDPPNALSPRVASIFASGRMAPHDAGLARSGPCCGLPYVSESDGAEEDVVDSDDSDCESMASADSFDDDDDDEIACVSDSEDDEDDTDPSSTERSYEYLDSDLQSASELYDEICSWREQRVKSINTLRCSMAGNSTPDCTETEVSAGSISQVTANDCSMTGLGSAHETQSYLYFR